MTEHWNGLEGFDRLLEHRVRLSVLVLASKTDALSFSRFKELLGETDGSLGTHLRKLEDAGYLNVRKAFHNRKPVTWYSLSNTGKKALKGHLQSLDRLIGLSAS